MPKAARLNDDVQEQLDGIYQRRYDNAFAWSRVCSMFQMLPGLRGFWPMSSRDNAGATYDLSGQGRTLTLGGSTVYSWSGLIPRAAFVAGTSDYLYRNDEAGLDIIGNEAFEGHPGLTIGGWFYPSVVADSGLMSKWYNTGNQEAYLLRKTATNTIYFAVTTDGSTIVPINTSPVTVNAWNFIVGRFTPSTELATFSNGAKQAVVAGIPATIFNSNEAFAIGRYNRANYYTGSASFCFLCGAALSDTWINTLYHLSRPLFGIR